MIRTAGGNESEVPRLLSTTLRPLGWHETIVRAICWSTCPGRADEASAGRANRVFERKTRNIRRERFLDGHKIDYVKGKVAFDLEWNLETRRSDRDLYAFSAFAQCGVVDVAVLLTRGASLIPCSDRSARRCGRTAASRRSDRASFLDGARRLRRQHDLEWASCSTG